MASSPAPRAEATEPEETAAPWYRWYVLGLLILTLLFSVADRLVFSILIEPIKAEFALSDTQLGLLGGAAFTVTYMFAGFPAARLADRSVRDNIRFTVGLQRRRSGLVPQLLEAAEKHLGGLPVAIVGHGGAQCLMTTGMHWIDLAIDVFGEAPTSVTAIAEPDMINPRGKDLEMWAGVAGWSFSRGRYLSLTYSNLSSVEGTLHMYCPTGRLDVAPSGDWQMYQRDAEQIKNDPRITRVGEATFQPRFVVANPTIHPTLIALNELDSDCELSYTSQDALVSLDAAIGALISAQTNKAVSFPITESDLVAKEWAIS